MAAKQYDDKSLMAWGCIFVFCSLQNESGFSLFVVRLIEVMKGCRCDVWTTLVESLLSLFHTRQFVDSTATFVHELNVHCQSGGFKKRFEMKRV